MDTWPVVEDSRSGLLRGQFDLTVVLEVINNIIRNDPLGTKTLNNQFNELKSIWQVVVEVLDPSVGQTNAQWDQLCCVMLETKYFV